MHSKRIVLTAMAALAGLHLSGSAWAQGEADNTIEPQPLTKALAEFAEQTGMQLVYPSELTAGVDSRGASIEGSPNEILDELLASTGLEYQYVNDRTIAIGEATDQGGDSDSKNSSPAPILMAQNTTQAQTTVSGRSEEGATSVVTGRVTDARTGANLRGAKVTIVETGQWTSTGDLGRFRFASVPTGSVTLTVSFLGYARQSAVIGVRGDSVSQDFQLRGGTEIEEIVVFGQRSARALALNQERTADNSVTVVSSDLLGQFEGTTISESLRRAPGVTFEPDVLTGEGVNIIVRGLAPDFNQITLNGQRLAVGDGVERSPSLNNILTESISEIRISKTLLPSQDSSGTGGLVEIETKGPLDRPKRLAQFALEGTKSEDDFQDEVQASATLSGRFGPKDNIGLSGSIQYRERDFQTVRYSVDDLSFGQYLPLDDNGNPITSLGGIDPRTVFPFEPGVDLVYPSRVDTLFSTSLIEDLSFTLSGQWQIGRHSDLRLDYIRAAQTFDFFSRDQRVGAFTSYEPLAITELGGEVRGALVVRETVDGELTVRGDQNYTFEDDREDTTDTITFHGDTLWEDWAFSYGAGYSKAEQNRPSIGTLSAYRSDSLSGSPFDIGTSIPREFLTEEALMNTVGDRIVSIYLPRTGEGYPTPLFNQDGFDFFNTGNYQIPFGSIRSSSGSNERLSFNFNAKLEFEPTWLDYVSAGLFFEESRSEGIGSIRSSTFFTTGFNQSLAALGVGLSEENLSSVGLNSNFLVIPEADLRSLFGRLDELAAGDVPLLSLFTSETDPRNFEEFTEEEELAGFIETKLRFGELEVIGGARVVSVDTNTRILNGPTFTDAFGNLDSEFAEQFNQLVDLTGKQTDLLPRISANYRVNDNFIIRSGYFRSVARPSIRLLNNQNATRTVSLDLREIYGPDGNQPRLSIRQGNPDLEPAKTDNYDLSFEYYDDTSVFKAQFFYKTTEDVIFNNENNDIRSLEGIVLPDDPRFQNLPDNLFVQGSRPENSPFDAEMWGLELVAEAQFVSLPSVFSGLGVFANYTYSDSELKKTIQFESGEVVVDAPYEFQPKNSYTVATTYSGYGIDASLSYSFQDRFQTSFDENNLSFYREEYDTLDFRVSYKLNSEHGDWIVFFGGNDLLKGTNDAAVSRSRGGEGATPRVFTGGTFLGGRSFSLGVSATF